MTIISKKKKNNKSQHDLLAHKIRIGCVSLIVISLCGCEEQSKQDISWWQSIKNMFSSAPVHQKTTKQVLKEEGDPEGQVYAKPKSKKLDVDLNKVQQETAPLPPADEPLLNESSETKKEVESKKPAVKKPYSEEEVKKLNKESMEEVLEEELAAEQPKLALSNTLEIENEIKAPNSLNEVVAEIKEEKTLDKKKKELYTSD